MSHWAIERIRTIPDFPKPGIVFKDITPLMKDTSVNKAIAQAFAENWSKADVDAIVGIESRGFIWGNTVSQMMGIPFVPVRKKGKLPADTFSYQYDLEYGSSVVEIHKDALESGQKVLIHDDLLATGGTAKAASELVKMCGGEVAGFSFIVELSFLGGRNALNGYSANIASLVSY